MKIVKGVQEYKHQLIGFEHEIFSSIIYQLARIGRPVQVEELDFIPFNEEVSPYIDSFSLQQRGIHQIIVVHTSFNDLDQKELPDFLYDHEMVHDGLIQLLGMLTQITGADGNTGSFLAEMDHHYISFWPKDRDAWICTCRNTTDDDGFYPCDRDGNLIEPAIGSGWDELYRCEDCGRVIDARDHRVLGMNLNPQRELED